MFEYMDELICLYRKARPGTPASFQDEEVKNQLLSGLHVTSHGNCFRVPGPYGCRNRTKVRKNNVIANQREALGLITL